MSDFSSPLEKAFTTQNCEVWVKRDDVIHPVVSGNKSRKLAHFLTEKPARILTFGGAYSNHIHATAYLGQLAHIDTVGVIRGEELTDEAKQSPTLIDAKKWGMHLQFVTRQAYRDKSVLVAQFKDKDTLVIPEGGCHRLGALGCRDIVHELSMQIDKKHPVSIICACGTGTTLAGLIDGVHLHLPNARVIGIPVLKGATFLARSVRDLSEYHAQVDWQLDHRFHDGGYGKVTSDTLATIQFAEHNFDLSLDKIYTAKAFRGLQVLIDENKLSGQVVFYHSGGLQGNRL